MIASVPLELNNDHEIVFAVGNEDGFVSATLLREYHGWSLPRFDSVINVLLKEGIVWLDRYENGKHSSTTLLNYLPLINYTTINILYRGQILFPLYMERRTDIDCVFTLSRMTLNSSGRCYYL
jgi:hypothetical protein